MEKYKEFWFRFDLRCSVGSDELKGVPSYIFSTNEDINLGKVWVLNANARTFEQALEVVYKDIEEDIEIWSTSENKIKNFLEYRDYITNKQIKL